MHPPRWLAPRPRRSTVLAHLVAQVRIASPRPTRHESSSGSPQPPAATTGCDRAMIPDSQGVIRSARGFRNVQAEIVGRVHDLHAPHFRCHPRSARDLRQSRHHFRMVLFAGLNVCGILFRLIQGSELVTDFSSARYFGLTPTLQLMDEGLRIPLRPVSYCGAETVFVRWASRSSPRDIFLCLKNTTNLSE